MRAARVIEVEAGERWPPRLEQRHEAARAKVVLHLGLERQADSGARADGTEQRVAVTSDQRAAYLDFDAASLVRILLV